MTRLFDLSRHAILPFLCLVTLSGCVSPKVVDYKAFHDREFSARAKAADIQQKTTADLFEGGYLLLGYIDLRRNVRTCYDDGQCVSHSDVLPSRDDIRQEAAQRGGDVVTLLEERTILEQHNKSYCISFSTTTVMVNKVPQVITTCTGYRTVPGKLEAKITRALIWRHDPQAARDDANARAIDAALKTLEAVSRADEAKPSEGRSFFGTITAGIAKKDDAAVPGSDPTSREIYRAILGNDREAFAALAQSGKLQAWSDTEGRSALMAALVVDRFDAARTLLDLDKGLERRDKSGLSALHYAVARGDVLLIQEFVKAGYDLRSKTTRGVPLLFYAAFNSRFGVYEWLTANGSNPAERTAQNETLLMTVAEVGREPLLRRLLNSGANVDDQDSNGRTALMTAARGGRLDSVQLLLKARARSDITDNIGSTVLHYAAASGKRAVLQALLERPIPINAENKNGNTALITALARQRWDAMQYLIDRGASLTSSKVSAEAVAAELIDKNQPRMLQRYTEAYPSLKELLQRDPRWLQHAAKTSGKGTIGFLADLGARINHPGSDGLTPLMTAASAGNLETVRALLELKADPSVRDRHGQTALRMATVKGHVKVVETLRELGARE